MALELRHLRGFVAVAQTLHFARAAETLGLSAPALTEQIQALERDLGTLLLRRTKRSVVLTPAGEAFLAEAQATLAQFERSVAVGRRAGQGALGRVVLGYVGSAVYAGVLQALVERFRTSHPDVTLQIQEQPMDRLPAMLEDGQVDVAFVRLPMAVPAALRAQVLVRDHFCLALPAGHPLAAAQAPVPARSLAQASFVAPEQTSGLQEVARRGRFEPRVVLAPGSLVAVLQAAILHDTIEDTDTTEAELQARFGPAVAAMVMEVTDDKALAKAERKALQVAHAPHKSPGAALVKLADKTCNLRDMAAAPPAGWDLARRQEYFDWARQVVEGLPRVNDALRAAFDLAYAARPVA
jgi:DNA-binding transcriptional LysR family regulator